MSYNFPEKEKEVLKFWGDNKIFEKLRQKNKGKKRWSFLDGPITANNPMGVHHAWGRTFKDLFQRYKAMQGYELRYQNGFDCQGLWVEVEVEKELGFKNKKDIEKYGIDKFVEKCKERVKKYSAIQTEQSIRLGQWMDWENSYYTMSDENNYAIWHFLKECWQKGYLYKGRDSVPWCPRCGTAISQHEILTEEYKEITHKAIYFKLKVIDRPNTYFLVWTTTPWTIPANVALAVNPNMEYGLYDDGKEKLILSKDLAKNVLTKEFALKKSFKGKALKGLKYEGPFDDLPRVKRISAENLKTFHTVVSDKDLVTAVEGTGIVHIAPGAGEEDFKIAQKEKLAVIDIIDEGAFYLNEMNDFSGKSAKNNPEIIFGYLQSYKQGQFFYKTEDYTHRYPTCWRCKTELVWRVVDEWYIAMDKPSNSKIKNKKSKSLRESLVSIVKEIQWIPSFGKERELDWLKNMRDWLISKKRYWGLALPIFECSCGSFEVIGSKEELQKRAIEGIEKFLGNSPHRPWIDSVKIKCQKCGKLVSRIPDVGNPWLDAGIVPYSTTGYFKDRSYWEKWFPAEMVAESFPGQFKNWFYSLLTMSAVLENKSPVKTIFGYALVKDEKGEEMHKSKSNAIWLDEALLAIGADPMRWMFLKQNPAENLSFGYNKADEVKRKLLILYNVFAFFGTYVKKEELSKIDSNPSPKRVLDRWILSKTDHLIGLCEFNLEKYDVAKAVLAIEDFFINDLSLWYIRRSRKRFVGDNQDRPEAVLTLYYALLNIVKLISPMMPFFAENIYQNLRTNTMPESVHLCDWPQLKEEGYADLELEGKMDEARNIVNLALAKRSEKAIKVRQPLALIKIKNKKLKIEGEKEILELIKDEINAKEIIFDSKLKSDIELDTKITKDLKEEGMARDIVRHIQNMRKEAGLKPEDKILVSFSGDSEISGILEKNRKTILEKIKAKDFISEKKPELKVDAEKMVEIDQRKLLLKIKKL
ncbi:MAG: isoleucine--tRNA ligase [Candidatus Staskawiczbacteria bacterium]|nr:isoleucine--tRNA ligase [Candidatus Staskawiczbacteria bacterium]